MAEAVLPETLRDALCGAVCLKGKPERGNVVLICSSPLPCSGRKVAPVVVDEAALPEILREALRAARQQSVARRAPRGGAGAEGKQEEEEEEDDDEVIKLHCAPCC